VDDKFVQDARRRERSAAYTRLVSSSDGQALAHLETGVPCNTPGIIRFPFERLAYARPDVTLIRSNCDAPQGAPENRGKTIAFSKDAKIVIEELAR
jgi:hypothetical protein